MKCPTAEDEYTKFIMSMIDALECVLGFWVQKYYGRTCAIKPGTYPTLIPDGDEFKNATVNVPGVYLGDNIVWANQCGPVMLDLFWKGCHNKENAIAYPFAALGGNKIKNAPRSRNLVYKQKGSLIIGSEGGKGFKKMRMVPQNMREYRSPPTGTEDTGETSSSATSSGYGMHME